MREAKVKEGERQGRRSKRRQPLISTSASSTCYYDYCLRQTAGLSLSLFKVFLPRMTAVSKACAITLRGTRVCDSIISFAFVVLVSQGDRDTRLVSRQESLRSAADAMAVLLEARIT